MKDRLFKLLGVTGGEESIVSVLLVQSVFLGIFCGSFDTSAHSLFLSIFDEKMLARGYVISGLAGILLTLAYTRAQARLPFRNFAVYNLLFVAAVTIFLWIFLVLISQRWVVFLVLVMFGPLNILAMLGFWGTAGRLFTPRQGKRLFSLIDAGLVAGIIISCYSIPIILSFNYTTAGILLISATAMVAGSIIQMLVGKRFLAETRLNEPGKAVKKKSLWMMVRDDRYIRLMGLFIALSVMAAFFAQYSFMAITREQYPSGEEMASFLGLFTGSLMIFTLLIKLLGFPYLVRNQGLRTCLAIPPVLIAIFALGAILIGIFMGYTPATGGFMLFFIMLALGRLFSKSLKDSFESPSLKIIYQTVNERDRFEVQSAMDGTGNEIAALFTGLLLSGLGMISFIKLIHFSAVLFIISGCWILLAVRLYFEYRNSIKKAIDSGGEDLAVTDLPSIHTRYNNRFTAACELKCNYFNLISGNNILSLKSHQAVFNITLLDHSEAHRDITLLPVIKNIASAGNTDPATRQRSAGLSESLEFLMASGNFSNDRLMDARSLLAGNRQPQTTVILRLLRDNSIEIRKLAILAIGKYRLVDLIPEVCESLINNDLKIHATSVLKSFGGEAREELCRYYLASSGSIPVCVNIIRVLSAGNLKENNDFIFSRLWSNSRQVKEVAAESLVSLSYLPSDEGKDRLNQLLSDVIGIIVRQITTRIVSRGEGNILLVNALGREIERWNRFLFDLLSVTYERMSVRMIQENLQSGTVESINFALEMADIVVDESLKPKLIPLIDIIPDEERIRSLYQFYPCEIADHHGLIEEILNRDYNLLGIMVRTRTLQSMSDSDAVIHAESLHALLFGHEAILSEETVKLFRRSDRKLFDVVASRLPAGSMSRFLSIINSEVPDEELTSARVDFLSRCFTSIDEEYLLVLAGKLGFMKSFRAEMLPVSGGYILWSFRNNAVDCKVKISRDRSETTFQEPVKGDHQFFYILPLNSVEEFIFQYPRFSSEIFNYIEINEK
jgi:ATP/ADP translocase